jgi:PAS domain-containing protein
LCIVDHQPRQLSKRLFEQLGQMAGLIAEHFELRLKEAHCDRVEHLLTHANQVLMLIKQKQNSVLSPLSQSAQTLLSNLPKITDLKQLTPFLPENQQSRYTRQLDQIYNGHADQFHQTIQLTLLNDMVHWFEVTISAERDSSGQLLRIFLHLDDITAQKDQQRHLLQTNQRYETILEATETGYWEWDMGENVEWSAECMKLLGFPRVKTKLSFTEFKEFLHPDDVNILFQSVDDAIKKSHGFSATFRLKNYLNTYTWVHGKGRVTAYHPNGKPAKMM